MYFVQRVVLCRPGCGLEPGEGCILVRKISHLLDRECSSVCKPGPHLAEGALTQWGRAGRTLEDVWSSSEQQGQLEPGGSHGSSVKVHSPGYVQIPAGREVRDRGRPRPCQLVSSCEAQGGHSECGSCTANLVKPVVPEEVLG